ncbi:MAG TPA: glycosyltransferase family 39 protein [Candidatus Limnocylindrales bacterium]|nr:glycosyltransferase family 39 protein [Candidatus Limnocylindrales bacterium]
MLALAAVIFLGCIISPPSLMDDVDAAHGQLARNMIRTGDWVIPQLDGVPYMEKAPLPYWLIAVSYLVFGVHDWAARIPFALGGILLCWITMRYGRWAFDRRAGAHAGLAMATSVGLFLFTRILIPDVLVTLCVALCFWAFQRALNEDGEEAHPRRWVAAMAASMAIGVLLKGLIAIVVPMGGILLYLACTRQLFVRETWKRLHLLSGFGIFLAIAAPWHVLATLRMPPHLDFTLRSIPGQYHGFFWFYFMNEHVLRFLGRRYPHDYNTVPVVLFWLLNLVWLFPASLFLPGAFKLNYRPLFRGGSTRLLLLCWIGFLLVFFSFSTTQEYYSMPIYPALAMLAATALDNEAGWATIGRNLLGGVSALAAVTLLLVWFKVHRLPAPGDISQALQPHPDAYTLSLGHMGDLTMAAFAYLRVPLLLAAMAFLVGAVGAFARSGRYLLVTSGIMMAMFFHASRIALVVFDPYLSSRPLARALMQSPKGELILDGAYYPFSSVLYYADRTALLLNGRKTNLEYGSYAPGAPQVFINDQQFQQLWNGPARYYLVAEVGRAPELARLGGGHLYPIKESGGKALFSNSPSGASAGTSSGRENTRGPW